MIIRIHLASSVSPSAGGAADVDRLEREFFDRFADLYRKFPGKYAFEVWQLTVVLRRR